MVESELRKVARAYLSRENPGHTLQPTALINEACIRLIEWQTVEPPSTVYRAFMIRCAPK